MYGRRVRAKKLPKLKQFRVAESDQYGRAIEPFKTITARSEKEAHEINFRRNRIMW